MMSLKRTIYITIIASIAAVTLFTASILWNAFDDGVRMRVYSKLRQLQLAMSNYEFANHSLPNREVRAESGAITFSWMVEVLPYFERNELYERIDLESGWNSDANRMAIQSSNDFWTWVCQDGYFPCPIDSNVSVWNPETGVAKGFLNDNCDSIALVAVPIEQIHPLEPFSISEVEMIQLLEGGERVFFIDCCGNYGIVELVSGVLSFNR